MLNRLQEYNFTVNGKKSALLKEKVEYLGFILTAEGCSPDPRKVKAIMELDTPTTKKHLRRFIGMLNYLRRHIPGLSNTIGPLTQLTGNSKKYTWTADL